MVLACRIIHNERDRHVFEKTTGIRVSARSKVLSNVKHELICAAREALALQQRGVGSAVRVRRNARNRVVAANQLDPHAARRYAMGSVQHMCRQLSHFPSLATVPLMRPYGSLVATKISFGFSIPNGARFTSSRC